MNPEDIRHERTAIAEEDFKVIVDKEKFDPDNYMKLIKGKAAIYWARGVMEPRHCERIVDHFFRSPHRVTYKVRPTIYTIAPPGGGSLYTLKDLRQYLALAPDTQKLTFELFDRVPNYLVQIIDKIRQRFEEQGIIFRAPRFEDQKAFYSIIRGWGEEGVDDQGNAARIHEDQDQITNPLQDGFELQQTYPNPQGSINCCYSNATEGGELVVYNRVPSHEDFAAEEVEKWGYGFPPSMVSDVARVSIRPETGDVFVLRSDCLHSVSGPRGTGHRVTAATLNGFKTETPEQQKAFAAKYPDLKAKYEEMCARFGNEVHTVLYWS